MYINCFKLAKLICVLKIRIAIKRGIIYQWHKIPTVKAEKFSLIIQSFPKPNWYTKHLNRYLADKYLYLGIWLYLWEDTKT